MTTVRPTDLGILLAALVDGREWLRADEIRGRLEQFGFDPSVHEVAAWLRRLCGEDMPLFESRRPWAGPELEYQVTRYGRTLFANTFGGLRA